MRCRCGCEVVDRQPLMMPGWAPGTSRVLAPTARLTSFSSNVAFPAPFNVPITFTAAATAGSASVEYKFWRFTSATGWTVARDYSSTNTYTWYPPQGSNAVQVWVRAVGSTASYQDWMSTAMFDVVVPPPRLATIQANVAFPAAPTTSITWTATASGGTGPLEYKFYRYDQSVGWVVMRDWNQSNQANWTPGASNVGEHSLQVWVRTVGSNVLYEDWKGTGSFLIATPEVSLTPDRPLTDLHLNDAITWTASVSGAVGPWDTSSSPSTEPRGECCRTTRLRPRLRGSHRRTPVRCRCGCERLVRVRAGRCISRQGSST